MTITPSFEIAVMSAFNAPHPWRRRATLLPYGVDKDFDCRLKRALEKHNKWQQNLTAAYSLTLTHGLAPMFITTFRCFVKPSTLGVESSSGFTFHCERRTRVAGQKCKKRCTRNPMLAFLPASHPFGVRVYCGSSGRARGAAPKSPAS